MRRSGFNATNRDLAGEEFCSGIATLFVDIPRKLAPGETGFVFIGKFGRGSTWRGSYCCKGYCSATILLIQLLAAPLNKESEYRLSTELTGHSGDVRAVVNLQTDEGQSVYVVTSTRVTIKTLRTYSNARGLSRVPVWREKCENNDHGIRNCVLVN